MLKRLAQQLLPSRLWSALRLARLRWDVARYPSRDVTHRYGPLTLTVHLSDPMAEGWYDHDWDEPAEWPVLRGGRLRLGATVFDIGAHQGVVALMLAHVVGARGRVIAVEASAHNADAARRNVLRNAPSPVDVVHAAAAERDGSLVINEGLNAAADDGTGSWGRVTVPAVTIDTLARRFGPPDLLYIDVEGYECAVLRGATETLQRRPDLFIEVHASALPAFGGSVSAILAVLDPAHYDRFVAGEPDAAFHPFRADDPVMRTKRFFIIGIARRDNAETASGPSRI